jgi:5,10-methylenetetrahydromethanopterin reductase
MTEEFGNQVLTGLRFSGPGATGAGVTATAADVSANARITEQQGFDYFGYGDTTWRDVYVTLTVCAGPTERIALGPGVTNPLTRDPFVTAQAVATLDQVSGGRAYLGIGMGQSANAIAGLPQATADQLRSAIVAIGSAHRKAREFAEWPEGVAVDEKVTELEWVTRRVPILVAAGFPKGLRIAAELADGVMLRAGDVNWSELPGRIRQLHHWRAQGPRSGDPFEVQLLQYSHLSDDPSEGRARLSGLVSARARSSTRDDTVPPDLLDAWHEYVAGYEYAHHASTTNPVNVRSMERLGLADYFFDRYCFVGTAESFLAKLEEIEGAGVTATGISGPPDKAVEVLGAYRARHPVDRLEVSPFHPAVH